MSETNIQTVQIADGTLSADLLPAGWTSPVWVLWEPEEAYLTLFPSMPDASTLEDVAALREMNIHGAIIGKAYYIGAIDLKTAVEVAL